MTIKIEAAISLLKVRFNRICKNYALRIMQISKNHLIRIRVSSSFSLYNNEAELDWEKNLVRWLEIWLDSKLSFKEHVEIKIAAATRTFYQIARLSNTERDLSFQAIKQLYIACITLIADYDVPVWWNNQIYLLEKY